MLRICSLLLCLAGIALCEDALTFSRPEVLIWPNGAPGSEGKTGVERWNPATDGFHRITNINQPSVIVFLPPKQPATGAAVIICPGGGHQYLAIELEGSLVAERLNSMGVAAFILKSRLARAPGSTYKVEEDSLADAQQAIRVVRSRAAEWNIKPDRIGIMGFSAGGEIAALAETRYTSQEIRPDFAVLAYGGLSANRVTLPKDTPPTFLVVANDDPPSAMVAAYYLKLRTQNVPAELHVYGKGGHGFGMTGRTAAFRDLELSHWPEAFQSWLVLNNFLGP